MDKKKKLDLQYDSEQFRKQGHQIIDILADYLRDLKTGEIDSVLPNIGPDSMKELWSQNFSLNGDGLWKKDLLEIIKLSHHIHHPKYIGHQVSAPLPFSSLIEMAGVLLNNGSAIYEMGPVNVILEHRLINWMASLIGYMDNADGVFTSGGTLGNLTALLAARQKMSISDVWKDGVFKEQNLSIIVSSQSHYSINRAVSIMGLGEKAVEIITVNNEFRMDIDDIKKRHLELTKKGKKVFALVANGCSTSTGTYDNLDRIADFCEQNKIWFHVDGAHGASILLSDKYKGVMKGVERADSVVWDAHKMLLMPSLITAVIFKDGESSYEPFSQKASYLFEKRSKEEWYNYAHRTMECTKKMMGLKLYLSLKNYGIDLFKTHIEYTHELAMAFAELINKRKDFELAVMPQSNIICFRYIKDGFNQKQLNQLQNTIRKKLLKSEKAYIVQTELNGKIWLRCTIINPLTRIENLNDLLTEISNI